MILCGVFLGHSFPRRFHRLFFCWITLFICYKVAKILQESCITSQENSDLIKIRQACSLIDDGGVSPTFVFPFHAGFRMLQNWEYNFWNGQLGPYISHGDNAMELLLPVEKGKENKKDHAFCFHGCGDVIKNSRRLCSFHSLCSMSDPLCSFGYMP